MKNIFSLEAKLRGITYKTPRKEKDGNVMRAGEKKTSQKFYQNLNSTGICYLHLRTYLGFTNFSFQQTP